MAVPFLTHIDLNKNELQNAALQNLASAPSTPATGQVYFDTTLGYARIWDGTAWQRIAPEFLSDLGAAQADLDIGNNRLTNVADPTGAQDAATKSYVDGVASGLDVKDSVRAATTANITLSGTQTIDAVALVANDRVLVKNQSTASENGIYVVAAGAWSRAADFDENDEVTAGAFTFVEEGTVNSDSGWVLTTDNPITVGTTDLAFAQFSGAGAVVAGGGLTKTGNTLDVGAGSGIIVNTDDVAVDFADAAPPDVGTAAVGTATQAAREDHTHGLPANVATVYSTTITGDGTATAFTVTHSLGSRFVVVQVHDGDSPYDVVMVDIEKTNGNDVTIRFIVPPANGKTYGVTVTG